MPATSRSVEAVGRQIIDVCERGGLPWVYVGHLYIGLAAHWRGDASRAEAELRRSVELEPPSAFGGQAFRSLARHLATKGASDDLWTCTRPRGRVPVGDRAQRPRVVELHARVRGGAVRERFPG